MTSLPLALVLQCLFRFALDSASCCLPEISLLSRPGATGELEVEFKSQRRSCKLSFLFPPHRQSAPESLLQAILLFASFSCVLISVTRLVDLCYITEPPCGGTTVKKYPTRPPTQHLIQHHLCNKIM